MAKIAIVYFSGYGHTAKQADAVREGVESISGATASVYRINEAGDLAPGVVEELNQADAIIYGSPTYMGGPAWQFKKFADESSKQWFSQDWKNKLAAGFTNSASLNGDKFSTIEYFWTLSQQHGQVWIGTGLLPANKKESGPTDVNWTAGFAGALAVSPADASPDEAPRSGDLETAKHLGKRVADFALVSVRPSKPVSDTWGSMDRCQARSLLCPMADPAAVSAERMFLFGSFRLLPSRWLLLDGETRVPLWISMSLLAESHGWEDKATSRLDQASMQGTRQEMVLQDWNRRGVHPAHRAARGNARSADGKGADVFSLGGL